VSEDSPYVPEPKRRPDQPGKPVPAASVSFVPRSPESTDFDAAPAAGAAATLGCPRPDLREEVVEVLQRIFDPEIPVNIYDLGLVYGIDVTAEGGVEVKMTLTSPSCPVAETLPPEVEQKVRLIDGVSSSKVNLVWEPAWGKHLLSEAARLQLGMD
jgi:FeS assembly SUF system protein